MFTRRSFVILLLVGLLIAANLGAVTKVNGDEPNQLDSALTSVSFQLPFHGRKYILQGPWGNCTQVVCREAETHRCRGTCPCPVWEAIDFDMEYENVYAAGSGQVDFAGLSDWAAYGNLVRIKHDNGFVSYYAHLSNWDRNFVAGETRVAKGQWLGVSGMSGTDNTHLHFEVRDASNNAVWVRDIPGMHWHSGDPNNPCGVKQGAYYGYGDGPSCEPLEQMSDIAISPEYIDYLTPSVTVRMRIRNRGNVRVGGIYTLLWSLRATDPRGGEHRWVVPVCYDGFDPGAVRDCTFTFEVPDYRDKVCRYSGAYRVNALEYGISTGSLEPAEWISLQNPNNYRSGSCLNACCASGASAAQEAQLQGCPNYCGGAPTPTTRPGHTPTPVPTGTPQPTATFTPYPPDSGGLILYSELNCRGTADRFTSDGCWNLTNARLAQSFAMNFGSRKNVHFYEGAGCNPGARQDEWTGNTPCRNLGSQIGGLVGSVRIAEAGNQRGIILYERSDCSEQGFSVGPFINHGCYNVGPWKALAYRANFDQSTHVDFFDKVGCDRSARQTDWTGFGGGTCQELSTEVTWGTQVRSIFITDPPITNTPSPTRRLPPTPTLVPPATSTPRPTNTPQATATIGPLQKGFGGFVYRVGTQEGIPRVHVALVYYKPDQGWTGGGSVDTDASGHFLLRTTQAVTRFQVVVFAPEGMSYHDVVIRHTYAKRVDERTIEWNLPSASTLGFFESDFLLAGQPSTATPTATRTPRPTKTPRATPTVTPAPTATQPPLSCSPIVILDWPWEGANLRSPVFFNGWAIDAASQSGSGVTQIYLLLGYPSDRKVWWEVAISERLDIAKGWGEKFRMSGYWGLVPLEEAGQYAVTVWANTSCGWVWSATKYFTVTELPIPTHHHVDHPVAERTYSSPFNFSGWTVKQDGQAVAKVVFYLDLLPGQVGKYGEDACDEYREDLPERYQHSGWHFFFDPAWVNPGRHRLYVLALDADGRWLGMIARQFVVAHSGE